MLRDILHPIFSCKISFIKAENGTNEEHIPRKTFNFSPYKTDYRLILSYSGIFVCLSGLRWGEEGGGGGAEVVTASKS